MNDLRKRAAGILEYITRTQVEMAGHSTPSKEGSGVSSPTHKAANNGMSIASRLGSEAARPSEEELKRRDSGGSMDEGVFKNLNSVEMMDVLTRELVLWQKDFGKYGEKA